MSKSLIGFIGAALIAGCAGTAAPRAPQGDVLRIEFASKPGAAGARESGVLFWRERPIAKDELPGDLIEKLGNTFPTVMSMDGKLANACFVTEGSFGITVLKRSPTVVEGGLWVTVDYAWTTHFELLPDGSAQGMTSFSVTDDDPLPLKGQWRTVADFSECYERVRQAKEH